MFNSLKKRAFGESIESRVADWLETQAVEIIERNFSCKTGEIDLIVKHREQLVFVEVRYRKTAKYGGGEYSVDKKKQLKLSRTAAFYLQQKRLTNRVSCRFDVVAVNGHPPSVNYNWIKNAFDSCC